MVSFGFVFHVSKIGTKLNYDVFLVYPKVMDLRIIRNCVLGNNFRVDLVSPIYFENGVVMGEDKQKFVV